MARHKAREKRSQESRRPADSVSVAPQPQVVSPHRFRVPRSIVFFVLFYLYFAFGIDVRLIYHCGGLVDNFPCFYWGWDYLGDCLAVPGGGVEYLSALLAQSFYHSWLGAAVMTGTSPAAMRADSARHAIRSSLRGWRLASAAKKAAAQEKVIAAIRAALAV